VGKVADNEELKLRATFYNNLAVGVAIGGFFLPYLAMLQRFGEVKATILFIVSGVGDSADVRSTALLVLTFVGAFAFSIHFRATAHRLIQKIQD
jgi:hypothetical protein